MFIEMAKLFSIAVAISVFLSGCSASIIPEGFAKADNFASPYVGKSVESLLKYNPNAEVTAIDIQKNNFRYHVKYSVPCSFEENFDAPNGRNECWIDVYFFSENGIIARYSTQRNSKY